MALPLFSLSINVSLAQNTLSTVERSITKTPEKFKEFQKAVYGENYYLLLTFDGLPGKAEVAKLADHKIKLLEYKSKNTYLAAIPADLNPSVLKSFNLKSVSEVEKESKLDSRLLSKDFPEWTKEVNGQVDIAIVFYEGTAIQTIQEFLQKYNATILEDKHRKGATVVARVSEDHIEAIAASPFVSFVDVKQEPIQVLNHENRINQKVNVLHSGMNGGYNLKGEGVVVGVGDGGKLGDHIDFGDRVINEANGTYSSFGDHGDHVSGIIGGAGNLNQKHKGMAPECTIVTQKTSQITYKAEQYFNDYGMVLTNNSYGTSFNCNTNGSYNYSAQTLDAQLRALPEMLHIFAAGNSGGGHCEPFPQSYHTVLRYYQSAKNVLTVGMAEENRTIANSSSRGPVKDGRLKPEIIGVGRNVISTSRDYNYSTKGGTSMAAPAVTGTLALLVEKYREENSGQNPDGALLKAIACNTADDLGNPGPDFIYGFGLINGRRAAEVIEMNQFYADEIVDGEMNVQAVNVPNGTKQLKIMLYWPDKEAAIYPDKALVNDLDISVITPSGETILPWVLDHTATGVANDAVRGVDNLNNIEQVTIDVPSAGMYTILIAGEAIPFGPQKFYTTYEFVQDEVIVTHPFGGESFLPGSNEFISWDADVTNTSTFRLEYSLDGGGTWLEIAPALPATQRTYNWTVPLVYSPDAIVRVSKNGTSTSGQNMTYFNIMDRPEDLVATPTCEKQMILEWTPSDYTMEYEVCMYDGDKMTIVGSTEETSFLVEEEMELGVDYWFSVRSVDMDGNASQRNVAVSAIPEDIELCDWEDNPVLEPHILPTYGRDLTSLGMTDSETVTAFVKNIGMNDLETFEVFYSVNGGTPVQQTFNGLLESGESKVIEFETPADLSGVGAYYIDTWVNIEGNNSSYSDSLISEFRGEQYSNYPIELPYTEFFESASSTTYTFNRLGLEGLKKWDLQTSGMGVLEIQQGSGLILRPTVPANGMPIRNEALLTLNMSDYSGMDEDIELEFIHKLAFEQVPSTDEAFENTISVRGSDTDEWVLAYVLDKHSVEWTQVKNLNISELLIENNQIFTPSFQLKFSNDNNLPFAISNIRLEEKSYELLPEITQTIHDFTVDQVDDEIVLNWTLTADENSYFEIELLDNTNTNKFDVIGVVYAEGTATQPYTFTDSEPGKKGLRSYRIKQIYADGSFSFSPVLSVLINNEQLDGVFPNPFVSHLSIAYNAPQESTIQVLITDQNGRLIQAAQVDVSQGEQIIPIEVGKNHPAGMYLVKILDGRKTICHKVVKQ